MASLVLEKIKEEVTCPICLELLKEPVSASCDHSFCRDCITLNYESSKDKEEESICPVCRVSYVFENLRPNRHVANIVERLTGFKSIPEEEQSVCAQHGEKLLLFCENDMVAICWLCERSQEHHGHQTALIEEVANKYKRKLQEALDRQLVNEVRCDEWEEELQQEKTYWEMALVKSDVDNVQKECKKLRAILDSEEENELQKLTQEKEDIAKSLAESENELIKQRQSVRDLASDLEHRLKCSTMEMLQDVNSVLKRSNTLRLNQPQIIPRKQRRTFRAPDLKGMLQVFQGLMDAQCYWVNLTLPRVNNGNLVISSDKRQIQNLNSYGRKLNISETYDLGVLGCQVFCSGKHYWEVDVSRSNAWLLGLNDGKCAKPQLQAVNKPINNVEQHVYYQPKNGYWVIGMRNRYVYNALEECSVTHKASVLALSLTGPLSRVGIFLDREANTLSFYDVFNHGALIYRFYEPSFPKNIYPYFNPLDSPGPMTIYGDNEIRRVYLCLSNRRGSLRAAFQMRSNFRFFLLSAQCAEIKDLPEEEVTCPICLDLMVEPVSADCGHSFCQDCITLNYESSKSKDGEFICPVCRVSYLFGNLRPNRHVANIVERLKGFKSSPQEEQKVSHCAKHGEKLQLFCEKDKVAICWLCERSQEHRGHQTLLIEEVAQAYKEKLQAALGKLMADKKELENWKDDLQKERSFWEHVVLTLKAQHLREFRRLGDILDSEEKNELQKLMQEKEDIMKRLAECEKEHAQQSKSLGDLISEVEHHLRSSNMEMLQGVDGIIKFTQMWVMRKSHTFSLMKPKTIPKEQRRVFKAPDLKGMLQVLQELLEAQRYWVQVTLVQNNNPNIAITEDKRQIRYEDHQRGHVAPGGENCHEGVLGYPAIQSGKHYWEVDVTGKGAWVLGLSDGSYLFNPIFRSNAERRSDPLVRLGISNNSHYQPKYGFWVIGLWNKCVYNAFEECAFTGKPSVLTLSVMVPPCRVGIFLDYAAGTLSFYNISHHGTLIYRFCASSFPDRVFPYFNPMGCSEPMTVCWSDS
ncbi:tripartite motif-containing protein 30A-like [Sigmodon hispidus]